MSKDRAVVHVVVSSEQHAKYKRAAGNRGLTMRDIVVLALERYLDENPPLEPSPAIAIGMYARLDALEARITEIENHPSSCTG